MTKIKKRVVRGKKKRVPLSISAGIGGIRINKKIYKGAFRLPIKTAIYVPSTNKNQKKVSRTELMRRVREVRKYLSKKYGGFTSYKGTGGFILRNGKLVKERIVRVVAFASKNSFLKNKSSVKRKIESWRRKWGQEAIGYEFEGDLYQI